MLDLIKAILYFVFVGLPVWFFGVSLICFIFGG